MGQNVFPAPAGAVDLMSLTPNIVNYFQNGVSANINAGSSLDILTINGKGIISEVVANLNPNTGGAFYVAVVVDGTEYPLGTVNSTLGYMPTMSGAGVFQTTASVAGNVLLTTPWVKFKTSFVLRVKAAQTATIAGNSTARVTALMN